MADLQPGDVIEIDRGGHTAVVESNAPETSPGLRARGYYATTFDMGGGRTGGWCGNGESMIRLAATSIGGDR